MPFPTVAAGGHRLLQYLGIFVATWCGAYFVAVMTFNPVANADPAAPLTMSTINPGVRVFIASALAMCWSFSWIHLGLSKRRSTNFGGIATDVVIATTISLASLSIGFFAGLILGVFLGIPIGLFTALMGLPAAFVIGVYIGGAASFRYLSQFLDIREHTDKPSAFRGPPLIGGFAAVIMLPMLLIGSIMDSFQPIKLLALYVFAVLPSVLWLCRQPLLAPAEAGPAET